MSGEGTEQGNALETEHESGLETADEALIQQLGEAFIAQVVVRVILETQDPDEAIQLIRYRCRKYLEDCGLGDSAAAIHLDKSGKQVKRWEQLATERATGGGKGYAIMRTVLRYYMERQEGATAAQCLGAIASQFPRISLNELLELMDFYKDMGYLVQDGEYYRRARAPISVSPADVRERLGFATDALGNIWPALRGYVIHEPGFELRRLHLFATRAEFEEFLTELIQFLKDWMERKATETSSDSLDAQREAYALLFMTSRLDVKGREELERLYERVRRVHSHFAQFGPK